MAGQPEGREPAIHFLMALRALDGRLKGGHDMWSVGRQLRLLTGGSRDSTAAASSLAVKGFFSTRSAPNLAAMPRKSQSATDPPPEIARIWRGPRGC